MPTRIDNSEYSGTRNIGQYSVNGILSVSCLLLLLLVDPEGKGLQAENHWQKTAYSLLVGCILHLCYKSKVEGTPATFAGLDHMLADSSRPIQELWNEMLTYSHINGRNHPVVSASARDMLDRPSQEAGSVLSTAKSFLELYRDPTVAKNTNRSDFRIRDLMHYTDPVSLYIITHPADKARLKPLVRIVVNMIVRRLADKMVFENGRPKPSYKHKLLAMIDEFPALGKLEILQESLAFVAGYGIKCYLISQDINQLKSRETGYGRDETITSNCHVQCAFPPNRLETAEHLSKLTGTTTIMIKFQQRYQKRHKKLRRQSVPWTDSVRAFLSSWCRDRLQSCGSLTRAINFWPELLASGLSGQ